TRDLRPLREAGEADAIADADAVIFLHDLTRQGDAAYDAAEREIAGRLHLGDAGSRLIHVHNKADVVPVETPRDGIALSAKTGSGLDALRRALLERAGWHASGAEGVFIARKRHVDALERCRNHLNAAQSHGAQGDRALDLFAEELRLAHDALGEITGAFTSDDLLGQIFCHFCIGK
ncbi:MAG: tRNA uridine-5-carboxymethylaminomethyl(34) synthesis GTPase MnmE, partial [Burkholderiales bacterium]|nr:tRNA uridine-5-carboxymethylaminomethyl(34) synthesis GTPase MnmE [Burkholderiales bacterium]